MSRRKCPGKKFEDEVRDALKLDKSIAHESGNTERAICDRIACYRGQSFIFEAKTTREPRIGFDQITPSERSILDSWDNAGAICAIVVKHIHGNKSRAWVCEWYRWKALEAHLGRKSIPLRDRDRPADFVELKRVERRDPFGGYLGRVWNLVSFMREELIIRGVSFD